MQRISTATKALDLFGAGKHGFKNGDLATGILPTDLDAAWFNGTQEELLSIIEGAGIAADAVVLTQVRQAIKRLAGGNVTSVNLAASPFALTADHAGLVLVDATAGNVVINLPAANVLAGLPYAFRRTDATANTVTVNRAGADTIDEGGASFTLTSKAVQAVRSNGASTWSTVTSVAASQAEINAGTDDAKFVTSKKVRAGFAASFGANGYIAFPTWLGGWIVQWGGTVTHVGSGSVGTTTMPLTWPTGCLSIILTDSSVASNNAVVWATDTTNLSNFTSYWNPSGASPNSTSRVARYIAVGK